MKLSVIVPSLSGAVPESLRDQVSGRDDVELIVVTGISPVGRARNGGLARATGEYVAWVDSDDEVTDSWLAEIRKAIAGGPDAVVFDAETVGHGRSCRLSWNRAPGPVEPGELVRAVYGNEAIQGHLFRVVTRRSLWEGFSFDERILACEDFLVLPPVLARARRAEYVPQKLYRYVRRPTGLSASVSVARLEDDIRAALRRYDETPAVYRPASARGSAWVIYYAIETARVSDAYRRAGDIDPAVRTAGQAFLRRHGLRVSRTPREAARMVTAMFDCWTLQRLAYRWRFGRKGPACT